MIAIVDYGAGNLFSVENALKYIGVPSVITNKASEIETADAIILPGVGAYPDAMDKLTNSGLISTLKEQAAKKLFLGICLGMQLLFEYGYEFEKIAGLSLIPGDVKLMSPPSEFKIPHMGWNNLSLINKSELLDGISDGDCVYFVHSYSAVCDDKFIAAKCSHGMDVTAVVQNETVFGTQFHPEKSGDIGLLMLKNFWRLTK